MQQKPEKYTNQTKEEIEDYLKRVKEIVKRGNYHIPINDNKRIKNKNFIEQYRINSKRQKQMLLELETIDFCYSVDDDKDPTERLYIFAREYNLDYWGIPTKTLVYIKIVIKNNIEKNGENVIVISFHEPEKNIKKLFV